MVDEFHRRIKEDTDESFSDSTCSSCLGGRSRRGGINITEVCAVLYNRSQLSPLYSTHVTSTKTITQRDPVPRSCHHSSRQQQETHKELFVFKFCEGCFSVKKFCFKEDRKVKQFFFQVKSSYLFLPVDGKGAGSLETKQCIPFISAIPFDSTYT
ncbi:hypothetical protein RRG08_020792 [Elysia crispata]|uniref:Uncharacterized protein n=1 Tax=Elysia crispata TaxID=231223 RepID=A0AAE1DM27_9GAST|nr:hypothetical protein RRG08_020792 [Elysia crispata]